MRHVRSRQVVLALIEKGSSLLATKRRNQKTNAMLIDLNCRGGIQSAVGASLWRRTPNYTTLRLQTFVLPDALVVTFNYGTWLKLFDQQVGNFSFQKITALRKRLHHQNVVVLIDDQRRQQIAFRINQAVGICFPRNRSAAFSASPQFLGPPAAVDGFISRRQKAESNFGRVTIESLADKVMSLVQNPHDRARLDFVCGHHVTAIDPKMAVANSFGSAC